MTDDQNDTWPVAIVLGAHVHPDGTPSPALCRRIAHAVGLYRTGKVSRIIVSGGPVTHPLSEARIMARLAMADGVPASALLLEPYARTTLDNAIFSLALMQHHDIDCALVVTDACHLPRALYTFRRLGARVAGSSPPSSRRRLDLACVRECVARLVYIIRVNRFLRHRS
ncbi:MAG: hypothetical protein FD149_1481 [Rhodospirillaceae bacterium]|nr:MAG: hypothetical protein FD149_1481 [Rhodospirillaceae bacterium]